jgi:hypothetical protein
VVFLGAGGGYDEWVGGFGVGCETLGVGLKEKCECGVGYYHGILTTYIRTYNTAQSSMHMCAPHPSIFPMRVR